MLASKNGHCLNAKACSYCNNSMRIQCKVSMLQLAFIRYLFPLICYMKPSNFRWIHNDGKRNNDDNDSVSIAWNRKKWSDETLLTCRTSINLDSHAYSIWPSEGMYLYKPGLDWWAEFGSSTSYSVAVGVARQWLKDERREHQWINYRKSKFAIIGYWVFTLGPRPGRSLMDDRVGNGLWGVRNDS